jgi:hypothetical protein
LEPDPSQHQQPRRRQPPRNKRDGGGAVAPSDRAALFKALRNVSIERGRVSESRDPGLVGLARFKVRFVSHPDISPNVPVLSPFSVQGERVVACRKPWL